MKFQKKQHIKKFINGLKNAAEELYVFVLMYLRYWNVMMMINCLNVYQDFWKRTANFKKELVENYKNVDGDFEKNYNSRTAESIYRIEHDSKRLSKWLAYFDIYYEDINYFDLLASALSALNEMKKSQ